MNTRPIGIKFVQTGIVSGYVSREPKARARPLSRMSSNLENLKNLEMSGKSHEIERKQCKSGKSRGIF